jgi:hypothetical protein
MQPRLAWNLLCSPGTSTYKSLSLLPPKGRNYKYILSHPTSGFDCLKKNFFLRVNFLTQEKKFRKNNKNRKVSIS